MALPQQVLSGSSHLALSPYLSEEAHVHSLQHPRVAMADRRKQEEERVALRNQGSHADPTTTVPRGETAVERASRRFRCVPFKTWSRLGRSLQGARDVGGSSHVVWEDE